MWFLSLRDLQVQKKTQTCIKVYFCWPEWEYVILLPLQHPPLPPHNSLCSFISQFPFISLSFWTALKSPASETFFFFLLLSAAPQPVQHLQGLGTLCHDAQVYFQKTCTLSNSVSGKPNATHPASTDGSERKFNFFLFHLFCGIHVAQETNYLQ